MHARVLYRIVEHNNWANRTLIRACHALTDEQLDAQPLGEEAWGIRRTLLHVVGAQRNYVQLLTLPPDERAAQEPAWDALEQEADASGEALRALILGEHPAMPSGAIRTQSGYDVDPWVVLVQAIHHGNDHRTQIGDTMRALGLEPPELAGWDYGLAEGALRGLEG